MVLLVLALTSLNLVRLGRAPAQGGPQALGNGDVDCDGQINITDPLVLLNWLFGEGPEPCAIAQTDGCCTELSQAIEELKQSVAAIGSSWPPQPEDRVTLEGSGPEAPSVVKAYVVPEGKVFVLTDLVVPKDKQGQGGAEILERVEGVTSTRWPLTIGRFSSALGIAFNSGSEVILRLEDATQGCTPTPCGTNYALMGYLLDD
jgi:hypothetical protein